jgi:N,N'-diacetyllegionaminate synthase
MMSSGKTFIIAEAGVNHNGNIDIAKKMIDVAISCNADAIKFQTFITEKAISVLAPQADYQVRNTRNQESQLAMVKKLELSFTEFIELNEYCKSKNILFLSTPFDLDSIDFLASIDMPVWKIPSGEITNRPYLEKVAGIGKPIIMSTGMCEMDEIKTAIGILHDKGAKDIKLLHCTTDYPAPFEDVNLRAMQTMREETGYEVGYSDHTLGVEVAIAAVALGASIIEKHFTLDRDMEGPDHKASIEPGQLAAMVTAIRNIETALGSPQKTVTASERRNIAIARKSIVATRHIKRGEVFETDNITTKRPGNGISALDWHNILGQSAIRDFAVDELIEVE